MDVKQSEQTEQRLRVWTPQNSAARSMQAAGGSQRQESRVTLTFLAGPQNGTGKTAGCTSEEEDEFSLDYIVSEVPVHFKVWV